MKFYFLHNHYIPTKVKNGVHQINSVIVPEFYPDLNNEYLGEPCYFSSIETYIDYVVQHGYYPSDTVFAIENIRIINSKRIRETLLDYKKMGVKIVQLYCGSDNEFFTKKGGLSSEGERLLSEISETDLLLDLSHIADDIVLTIASGFNGRMIISHCACTDLYFSRKPRSNSLTRDTVYRLAEYVEVFGLSFLNDIIASSESELNSTQIFDDLVAQILLFANVVGPDKVALAPDYIDTEYFSRLFNAQLFFPEDLLTQDGLLTIADRMSALLSPLDVKKILSGNVERLLLKARK